MLGLRDFICKLADREDDRIAPQKNHLVKARFFHGSRMRSGGEETKEKEHSVLANVPQNAKPQAGECVGFTSLWSFTGKQLRLSPRGSP